MIKKILLEKIYIKYWLSDLKSGVPYGIRTRVAAVKGRCPEPLDEGDIKNLQKNIMTIYIVFLIYK